MPHGPLQRVRQLLTATDEDVNFVELNLGKFWREASGLAPAEEQINRAGVLGCGNGHARPMHRKDRCRKCGQVPTTILKRPRQLMPKSAGFCIAVHYFDFDIMILPRFDVHHFTQP